ncbi:MULTISPECIES: RNA polymerase sigma factor [Butyricimonas]|uniref:RNA polymerase sigma factor n=1 Tax=Butyricimonas TaxID=574697 RepID=UPI0007FB4D42|nr:MULTISPECIES: sigma-70 family RNA polymerase sigma factor [Butyricimonas]
MEDYSALEKFIRNHYASLCAVASRFVDNDTAQDITQDVLFKFWEKREKYVNIDSIDNFLFIMIRNEAISHLRQMKHERERYAKLPQEESEEPAILHILIEEESNQILVNAINQLPPQAALIIRLVLSGYDNKEIARLIDVSINTVKTLKYGAIRKLREYFNHHKF